MCWQLARKDEEVVFQTQEINNLKSMLTGMRVSRSELGRIQTEQQQDSKSKTKYSNFEEKAGPLNTHPIFEVTWDASCMRTCK